MSSSSVSYFPSSVSHSVVPRKPLNLVGVSAFWLLAVLCILRVNIITLGLFGTGQVFSLLYLLACLVVLVAFQFMIRPALGRPGRMWFLAILVYLAISTRMGLGLDLAYFTSPESNFYRMFASLLITACAAMAVRHLVLAGRTQMVLRGTFLLLATAAASVLLTKYWPALYTYLHVPSQDRQAGLFTDPNRAGQAICVAAAVGFACLIRERVGLRPFVYAGMVLLLPCLFLTYSRSAILFFVVLVMLQFVISPIMKRKEMIVAILIMAIGIPLGVAGVLHRRRSAVDIVSRKSTEHQQERMTSLFRILSGDFDDTDTGHRFVVAQAGLRRFFNQPISGAGFQKLVALEETGGLGCHNTFIRIFGEAGILAGGLFVAALGCIAWQGWHCPMPEIRCFSLGFVAMYSCACMVSHAVLTARINDMMLGITFGLLAGAQALSKSRPRVARLHTSR